MNNDYNYYLYKKIFNNIVLNKNIYCFVKYNQFNGNEENSKLYQNIKNSLQTQDLTIENLIKGNHHKLFEDFTKFYFKIAQFDKFKYNYFQIELKKKDLLLLCSYNRLEFSTFIEFYNKFNKLFIKYKDDILTSVSKGGNIEIFNFIKSIKYSRIKKNQKEKEEEEFFYKFKEFYTLNQLKESFFKQIIQCGNNLEIFKQVFKHHIQDNKKLVVTSILIREIIMSIYYEENTDGYLKYIVNTYKGFLWNESTVEKIMGLSLNGRKFELTESIVETNLFKLYNGNYSTLVNSCNYIDFKTLKYYWDHDNETSKEMKLLNSESLYFNISCELLEWNHRNIEIWINWLANKNSELLPSLNDFKYIIQNNLLKLDGSKIESFFKNTLILISTKLFDLEYLKFILDFINQNESLKDKLILPLDCFDSKFEIVKFLFENESKYKSILYAKSNLRFKSKNAFFGDTNSAKLFFETFTVPHLMTLEIFIRAIILGYFEILQLIESMFQINYHSFTLPLDLIGNTKVYKYIYLKQIKVSSQIIQHLKFNGAIYKDKEEYYYIYNSFNESKPIIQYQLLKDDHLQFKIIKTNHLISFFKKNPKCLLKLFSKSKLSITEILIEKHKILPSIHLNTKKLSKQLIDHIFKYYNTNKLIYFVENDSQLIQSNILLIVYESCRLCTTSIINSILVSNNFNQQFKQKLFIQTILLVLEKQSKNYYFENSINFRNWYFNLINFNVDLNDINDINKFNSNLFLSLNFNNQSFKNYLNNLDLSNLIDYNHKINNNKSIDNIIKVIDLIKKII